LERKAAFYGKVDSVVNVLGGKLVDTGFDEEIKVPLYSVRPSEGGIPCFDQSHFFFPLELKIAESTAKMNNVPSMYWMISSILIVFPFF